MAAWRRHCCSYNRRRRVAVVQSVCRQRVFVAPRRPRRRPAIGEGMERFGGIERCALAARAERSQHIG
eukprot:11161141-Lingulodinium_polyedra.AAC.1